mgnify:CR=1 FL=1
MGDMNGLQGNFILFSYEHTLLGLTRKHRINTDKLNESVKEVSVHNATTDLSADDPIYRALKLKRQDFINKIKKKTLEWQGNLKLVSLDSMYFDKFKEFLDKHQQDFTNLVDQFLPNEETYNAMKQRAYDNDPQNYDASMYPSFQQARAKFSFSYNFIALSTMKDQRLDAVDRHADFIKQKAEQDHLKNIENLESQTQERILSAVEHIIKQFSSTTKKDKHGNEIVKANRFQESSMNNHLELVEILKAFNISNNSKVNSLITDFERAIDPIKQDRVHDFETLRDDESKRLKIKSDMESILSKFNI